MTLGARGAFSVLRELSPIDALVAMIGEKDIPKVIAQGVLDVDDLPAEGEERTITVPLIRPLTSKPIGSITLILSAP